MAVDRWCEEVALLGFLPRAVGWLDELTVGVLVEVVQPPMVVGTGRPDVE